VECRGDAWRRLRLRHTGVQLNFNAVLKNALDFLSEEWAFKPALIVSYGGVSAGTRAAQMLKQVPAALKMIVVGDVSIPFVVSSKRTTGRSMPTTSSTIQRAMLDELLRVTT
jgi:NAD(P)H-dependent FMN reductase